MAISFKKYAAIGALSALIGLYGCGKSKNAEAETLIKECFDDAFQARLSIKYDLLKKENPGAETAVLDLEKYKECFYAGIHSDSTMVGDGMVMSINNDSGSLFMTKIKPYETACIGIKRVGNSDKWDWRLLSFNKSK